MDALEGVRLIDFGQYLAGPFGPMIIGDLGADVIKVEPVTGDGMRMAATPYFGCQRGKRDIALNIKTPEGHEIAHEARGDGRHRPPQHDEGDGRPAQPRLRGVSRGEARPRLLQHVRVRARGSAGVTSAASTRCTRRRPGSSTRRARCPTATSRSTTATACATPRTRCCRSSACSPRCTTSARPARARSCGRA